MGKKIIYGLFNDDHMLIEAAKDFVKRDIRIKEIYSPFPIHGIEKVLGVKWTRLAVCAFLFGLTGATLALLGMWYFMIYDWPLNIGGKPNFELYQNIPSFIPITFEFTVLCAGHGMAITFLFRNWTFPGVTARNPHPKTTDDHFAMEIHLSDNPSVQEDDIRGLLGTAGAVEIWDNQNKQNQG